MRLNKVSPSKELGASPVNWSVGLVCLHMHGIPRSLGCSVLFISGAGSRSIMFEALSGFCSLPSPPFAFHCVIGVTDACLIQGVGAHGWVVRFCQPSVQSPSWSWLPIVVAPGCLRHPTSTDSECDKVHPKNCSGYH